MTKRNTVTLLTMGATILAGIATAQDAGLPALPALPAAADASASATTPEAAAAPAVPALPAIPTDPAAPALPGVPPAGGLFGGLPPIGGAANGTAPSAAAATPAVPVPPTLENLTAEASDGGSTSSAISGSAPSQLYTFLFIDDPEYGIVRQRFTAEVAQTIKDNEIQRLQEVRQTSQGPQAGGGLAGIGAMGVGAMGMVDPTMGDPTIPGGGGVDPMLAGGMADMGMPGAGANGQGIANTAEAVRAAAEWDFYYGQLEMYDAYVREKLIPNAEDLPDLTYDATNVLQERQDLFESFQQAAIEQSNQDSNDNRAFYERIQKREDRRIAYYQWVMHKQNEVAEWADVWARKINGNRWADGEEVRVDDWYYGTDFNSATPVIVAMDNREYVVSRQPVDHLKPGQLNVISSNLTPYDIIDANGNMKNPQMETLRGTLVVPPVPSVYTTPGLPNTGTIEIVPGN